MRDTSERMGLKDAAALRAIVPVRTLGTMWSASTSTHRSTSDAHLARLAMDLVSPGLGPVSYYTMI